MMKTRAADAYIFDVDGVLLDVTKSFPEVIRRCVAEGWETLCGGETDCAGYGGGLERVLKRHGAFNDDYDIAWLMLSMAAASGEKQLSRALPSPEFLEEELRSFRRPLNEWLRERYGNLVPRYDVRRRCAELYGTRGRGLHLLERPMLKKSWRELSKPCAIYSGRNGIEWELAKESLGWEDFPDELVILSDSGITKPSPEGLELLCARLGAAAPAFFGDTASDMQAWQNFGRGSFAAVGGLLPEAEFVCGNVEEGLAAYGEELSAVTD